jgi:phosphoribosylanthranilate isomerase
MFQIKICGVTSEYDGVLAAAAGATAIGLNFYEKSPRYLSQSTAQQIVATLPKSIEKVGVFVNESVGEVCQKSDSLRLDWIQLHGDEPPEYLAQLEGRRVLRAFRVGSEGLTPVLEYLLRCEVLGCKPRAILLDARSEREYGGTGKLIDWQAVSDSRESFGGIPLVLAGGLTPENVAHAIEAVQPDAVDTASGVESSPGKKDESLVAAFVSRAQVAFSVGNRPN